MKNHVNQERPCLELPARRGEVRQDGRAGGGRLRRFGPISLPSQGVTSLGKCLDGRKNKETLKTQITKKK